jgi:RNA polymerase sigma factor for flagellar operon FliA
MNFQTPRLPEYEISILIRRWQTAGDHQARERVVYACGPVVRAAVDRQARTLPAHADRDELLSSAYLGLLKALCSFDCSLGVDFTSYAWTRMNGEMLDGLRRLDWCPRGRRDLERRIRRVESEQESITAGQTAAAVGITVEDLREHQELMSRHVVSLDQTVDGDGAVELIDLIAAPLTALAEVEDEDARGLREALAVLTVREREVISRVCLQERRNTDVGRELGISESRVSQIVKRGRIKLERELRRRELAEAA